MTYKGYWITTSPVEFDGYYLVRETKDGPTVYCAPKLRSASKWVDAYRAGQQWAVSERLRAS